MLFLVKTLESTGQKVLPLSSAVSYKAQWQFAAVDPVLIVGIHIA